MANGELGFDNRRTARAAQGSTMRTAILVSVLVGCAGGRDEDVVDGQVVCPVRLATSGPETLTLDGGANFHPRGFVGDPTIVHDGETYHVWLTSSSREHTCPGAWWECLTQGFAYAQSADGLVWDDAWIAPEHLDTEYTKLVLSPADAPWAPHGLETASALRRPDGTWMMFFTGHQGPPEGSPIPFRDAIGLAESTDGVTWTARPEPVFEAESAWERFCVDAACETFAGGVLEPSVLWNEEAGRFEMWYAGFGQPADSFPTFRIGHAVSPDGIAWTRDPEPVLNPGRPGSWDEAVVSHPNVVYANGTYHLFYHASGLDDIALCEAPNPECPAYTPGSVGHARSNDGVHWIRSSSPLIDRTASPDHAFFVGGPTALAVDGGIDLTVFGNPNAETAAVFDSHLFRYQLRCEE
jgi:hypothetical protein